MELEETANLTNVSLSNDEDFTSDYQFYRRIFLEIFTMIGIINVFTNIIVLWIILKNKTMRENIANQIFAHANFLSVVYFISTGLTFRSQQFFEKLTYEHVKVYCVFFEIENTVVIAMSSLLFLLVCEWYTKLYCERLYFKFRQVYNFFIAFVYISILFVATVTTRFCLNDVVLHVIGVFMSLGFIGFVLFLTGVNIAHAVKKRRLENPNKNNMGLFVANMFVLLWLPVVVLAGVAFNIRVKNFVLLFTILFSVGLCSPILNFVYLFFCDNSYNVHIKKIFKCQCKEYGTEILDEHSVTYSDLNGVQVSDK